jgi:hypothetical protein
MTAFTDKVSAQCWSEYKRFDNGKGRETDAPYAGYVGEYWSFGLKHKNIDGRTTFNGIRPPWSSAFICYIMRKSGAGSAFFYQEAHIHYVVKAIQDARQNPPTAKFLGRDPVSYAPKVGDLINEGRADAAQVTYKTVLKKYGTKAPPDGNFMPSHSDIVVAVDLPNRRLTTIGGNVGTDTVNTKSWALKADGTLAKGPTLICVVECLL